MLLIYLTMVAGMRSMMALAALVAWSTSLAAPPGAGHPIVGTWRYTLPDGQCTETYVFRADGTSLITSGAEVAEGAFEISAEASPKGFYRMADRVVRDNGGKDCAGEVTPPGHKMVNFVRIHPSREMMLICGDESPGACFGPLRRVPEQSM